MIQFPIDCPTECPHLQAWDMSVDDWTYVCTKLNVQIDGCDTLYKWLLPTCQMERGEQDGTIDADELKTAFPCSDNSKHVLVASVRATINHMPTIEPQQQWIPCKERLPKTTKWRTNFVVTVECDGWNPKRKTMVAELENTTVRGKPVSRWIWNNRLFPADWKIIAWGPLPAPYREDET